MNVKDIRRENLRSLARSIGGITAIAKRLDKSQSQISHLIGTRPIKNIGDRLASEIEVAFEKPHGWLDKEHFRATGESGTYIISNAAPRVLSWLPIIKWPDISYYKSKLSEQTAEFVPVNFEVSKDAFALRVEDDSMDAPIGISFPKGTVIVVDPSHIPTHSSFVVAYINNQENPAFRQLIYEGNQPYLKPLNPRYDHKEATEQNKIVGVIRQLMMKLE